MKIVFVWQKSMNATLVVMTAMPMPLAQTLKEVTSAHAMKLSLETAEIVPVSIRSQGVLQAKLERNATDKWRRRRGTLEALPCSLYLYCIRT